MTAPEAHHETVMLAIQTVDKRVDDTHRRITLIEDEVRPLRGMEERLMAHVAEKLSPLAELLTESEAAKKRQEKVWNGIKLLIATCGGAVATVAFKALGWL